jgi:membrane fusion protein (multidrug efflux system)
MNLSLLRVHASALVIVLASFQVGCSGGDPPILAETPAVTPAAEAVPVTVAAVTLRPTEQHLKFVGTLFGNEEVTLSSQAEGQVEKVPVDLGDAVTRGQVLIEIEDDDLRARLREIEVTLDKARADEARARALAAKHVISPQEYEAMQTAVAVSEAQRDTLNVMVGHTQVRSPLDGHVARRHVSAGEYVRAGTPLLDLVADHPLKLRGDVPERFARDLAVEQPVQIRVDAYPDKVFTGKLARISPTANRENRSISVEALVENADHRLKPGFFANASIITRSDAEAFVVPETAVISFAGISKVFVVRDGIAYERRVRVGTRDDEGLVEILGGVTPDEKVATSGLAKLGNGTVVVVRKTEGGS